MSPLKPVSLPDLISDLVACAMIEGYQHTRSAQAETQRAKEDVLERIELIRAGLVECRTMVEHPDNVALIDRLLTII